MQWNLKSDQDPAYKYQGINLNQTLEEHVLKCLL